MKTLRLLPVLAVLTSLVLRAPATVFYVNANGTTPTPPFADWNSAATNIQDAVDAASPGDLVWVTNGIYQTGGQFEDFYGNDFFNRVLIDKPMTMRSVNGPAVTTILGNAASGTNGVRCVYMADAAVLSGFTLKNGGTMDYFDWAWWMGDFHQQSGGGVYAGANSIVTNCVITGCSAYVNGGGAANGILKNCTLTNNRAAAQGGGAINSVLQNCSLLNNQSSGGGAVCGRVLAVDPGVGGDAVCGAVWAGADERAAAELCAIVQPAGNDSGSVDWETVHLLGSGAEAGPGSVDEGRGDVQRVSAWGDHAGGADVHRVGVGGAAVCAGAVADALP